MIKSLMVKRNAGFTLVEVTLVMAIGAGLLVIVLAGQRQLRSQATFTAAVDKVIASIAEARNMAASGVNVSGSGTGAPPASCVTTSGVSVGINGTVDFAGTRWSSSSLTPTQIIDTWVTANDNGTNFACIDAGQRHVVGVPTSVQVRVYAVGSPMPAYGTTGTGVQLVYLRQAGGFRVCTIANTTTNASSDYSTQNCGAGQTSAVTLLVTDADNNHKVIKVDPITGLASR